MNTRVTLFLPGDSWLHRLDPRAKLLAVLLAGTVGLLYKHIGVLAALLVLAHLVLLSTGIPARRLGWLWLRLSPLLLMILILQPLFASGAGPALVRLGPVSITLGGVLEAVSFVLRAASLTFVAATLLLTTDPADLVQGLVKMGLPYSWGLTVGLAIRYLPTIYGLFGSVQEAQQARGWMADQPNLVKRVRAYLPVLVATIIGALRLSDNLGLALAARGLGYPARRTALRDVQFTPTDWAVVGLAVALFGLCLVGRWALGFGAAPW